jgi:hypothetical protein
MANPAEHDLTSRMPTWTPLALPLDTSAWTQDTSMQDVVCDENTFQLVQDRYDAASENTVLLLPNCTISVVKPVEGRRYNQHIWNLNKDGIEFLGQENTKFRIGYPPDTLEPSSLPNEGVRSTFFIVGSEPYPAGSNVLNTCRWVGGFDLGTNRIDIEPGCAGPDGAQGWYPGDLIRVKSDVFQGPGGMRHSNMYRIACIDGPAAGTSDRQGTTEGCARLDADNQIALDRPLYLDYNDGVYFFRTIPGKRIEHLERKGGGEGTDEVVENVGFRNIEFEHEHPYTLDARNPVIRWQLSADGWSIDNKFSPWGGVWQNFTQNTGRILTQGNTFIGPLWRARCVTNVLGITRSNPVEITLQTGGCDDGRWNGSFEGVLYLGENVDEPALAGKFFAYDVEVSPGGGQVVVTLEGVDGSSFHENPGGYASNMNKWNIAASYSSGGSSEIQIIDNVYINPRVGPLLQGGAGSHVIAYNYLVTDDDVQCSRGVFFHGNGSGAANLIEGNDMDCAFVPYASSNRSDDGEGIYMTVFQNRWRNTGPGNGLDGHIRDQCPRGTICVPEQTDQEGTSTEFTNIIGNVFYDFAFGNTRFDNMDNDDDQNGLEEPYFLWKLFFAKNLFYSGNDIDDNFDDRTPPDGSGGSGNPTTIKPDVEAGDENEATSAIEAYSDFTPPTSLFYKSVPEFWCAEGGTFPSIGAFYDDMGAMDYAKLPAQRRYEGLACNGVVPEPEPEPEPEPDVDAGMMAEPDAVVETIPVNSETPEGDACGCNVASKSTPTAVFALLRLGLRWPR